MGTSVGKGVGNGVVGTGVGAGDGIIVGSPDGEKDGNGDGIIVGCRLDGTFVGKSVGNFVGVDVGGEEPVPIARTVQNSPFVTNTVVPSVLNSTPARLLCFAVLPTPSALPLLADPERVRTFAVIVSITRTR